MDRIEAIVHLQYYYDIGAEIDLEVLRSRFGLPTPPREPEFRHSMPDYVRFESSPLLQTLPALTLPGGDSFGARIGYFHYGAICLELNAPFDGGWNDLIAAAAKWPRSGELDAAADRIARELAEAAVRAIKKPARRFLREDYVVVELLNRSGKPMLAADLLSGHGADIAQIVRGETLTLSPQERAEVLESCMSYSTGDLLVVGYGAALVHDEQPEGAVPVIQILEYANTQLLEYRFYDELLAGVLADVYRRSASRAGFLAYWLSGREASKLNTLRLEVMELTEKTDNAIKFLSDMFYARAYRLASSRIGVPDYRRLVEEKLMAAGEQYRFMMDKSHNRSAFILELTVVIILIVEMTVLFMGKAK